MATATMSITTPLGADVLLFHTMSVQEELGTLPQYDITVLSDKRDVNPSDLLGLNVTVKLEVADAAPRYWDGYVVRFALAGKQGRYYRYVLSARPWLWFLTRQSDCRIFQAKKVPDILKDVFSKYTSATFTLSGSYRTRDYCVQYRETDFNFVSRLMEEEGIYYYFKHSAGKHEMVVTDSLGGHAASAWCPKLPYIDPDRPTREERDQVNAWTFTREIQPGAYALEDYNFETPSVDLLQKRTEQFQHPQTSYEYYDYPGLYPAAAEGKHYVQVRLEELHAQYELGQGTTTARGLRVGDLFNLTNYPRDEQNREYLVVAASHQLQYGNYEALGDMPTRYACRFTALYSKVPFRRRRLTPKPVVQGVQPAIVVGPAGDEIYTDKYSRIKVQFYWDRQGKKDENSSCWVRVATPWAGKNWGMIHIPRIGQEVVVDFVEGDPDQPLVVGSVYNAEQMPPWALPANMTQSGVLSRSSKGGSGANANALRFEDKKGSEQVWLHAEKNMDREVENDDSLDVGHDQTETIGHDRTVLVKNHEKLTVEHGREVYVNADGEKHLVVGTRTVEVKGHEERKVTEGRKTEITGTMEEYVKGERKAWVQDRYSFKSKTAYLDAGPEYYLQGGDLKFKALQTYTAESAGLFSAKAGEFRFATTGDISFTGNNFNRTIFQGNDTILGQNTSCYIGASRATAVGSATTVYLGMSNAVAAGMSMQGYLGLQIANVLGLSMSNTVLSLANVGIGIGMTAVNLTTSGIALDSSSLHTFAGGGAGSPAATAALQASQAQAAAIAAVVAGAVGLGVGAVAGIGGAVKGAGDISSLLSNPALTPDVKARLESILANPLNPFLTPDSDQQAADPQIPGQLAKLAQSAPGADPAGGNPFPTGSGSDGSSGSASGGSSAPASGGSPGSSSGGPSGSSSGGAPSGP